MRNYFWLLFLLLSIQACRQTPRLPVEARRPIPITLSRFEEDFFALDTLRADSSLQVLADRYPAFLPGFLTAILGVNPADPRATEAIKAFLQSYRPVYTESKSLLANDLETLPAKMEEALQWLRYLSPSFRPDSPFVITSFIGPMDAYERFSMGDYGDVRTANGVGVALQFHLGPESEIYRQGMESGILYQYQVQRFSPHTMLVNAMKNVIEDHFPYTAQGKPLVEEMVEKGKRMYLLKRTLPGLHDSLLLGYTGAQWQGCLENEGVIWQFFVKNDLLYGVDPSINQIYIQDGPKTPELGEASPGYIGLFLGLRMVESFIEKHDDISIDSLMQTPAGMVFQQSGYRPK